MPIDGGMRDKLQPGTKLVATYKGTERRAEVIAGEDGKVRFRLDDGREFKSPSSAGSAVMDGRACNGWRFFSIEDGQPKAAAKTPERPKGQQKPVQRAAKTTKAPPKRAKAAAKPAARVEPESADEPTHETPEGDAS